MGLLRWLMSFVPLGGFALGVVLLWLARDLPRPDSALDAPRRPSMILQDTTGKDYATFGNMVGEPMRLSDLPAALPQAVVAFEDRHFWQHHGFDLRGLARAAWVNLRAGRLVQGG